MLCVLFHLPMLLAAGLTAFGVFMNIGLVNTVLVKPAERESAEVAWHLTLTTNVRGTETFVLTHLLAQPSSPRQVFHSSRPSLVLPNLGKSL